MDVNEAMAVAAAEIAADIDREIIMSILFPYSCPHYRRGYSEEFQPHVDWLSENIGKYTEDWAYSTTSYYFKTEKDMLLFTMRWA